MIFIIKTENRADKQLKSYIQQVIGYGLWVIGKEKKENLLAPTLLPMTYDLLPKFVMLE